MEQSSRVILVSNRLPVTLSKGADGLCARPSSGGLATALSSVHGFKNTGKSLWIGWPGPVEVAESELQEILDPLGCISVPISTEEVTSFYDNFSNGVLWPLCHYLLDKVNVDTQSDWVTYKTVNQRFAHKVAEFWKPGDVVWVQDYQLMLVPLLLRQMLPQAKIGFFLHVPFVNADVFRILPFREELLRGMLGADVVGFHTAGYAHNFSYCCSQLLGLPVSADNVDNDGRIVHVEAFPIGINAKDFAARAVLPNVEKRAAELIAEAGGRRIVLAVDRTDYTKGIVRRLLAIDRLLCQHPEYKEKLHFIQVAVPTRENVDAYSDYKRDIYGHLGRINATHGNATRSVIHLMYSSVSSEELSALYVAADIMMVTPLRDGMNLVAKEYIASRVKDTGVLILSEFAGAAIQLHEAMLVNPYDTDSLAAAIVNAANMPEEEQKVHMSGMRNTVGSYSVDYWASSFLNSLENSLLLDNIGFPLLTVLNEAISAENLVLFLDYDGTLVEFATSPLAAKPDRELLGLISDLANREGTAVHVVSGRSLSSLMNFFSSIKNVSLHGEHGLKSLFAGSAAPSLRATVPPVWMKQVQEIMEGVARRTDGAFVEGKSGAIAFHFRVTEPNLATKRVFELTRKLDELNPEAQGFEVLFGNKVVEVRIKGITKGLVVKDIVADSPKNSKFICIGDDHTDEDMFKELPDSAISIHVGTGKTSARFRLPHVKSVRSLLLSIMKGVVTPRSTPKTTPTTMRKDL